MSQPKHFDDVNALESYLSTPSDDLVRSLSTVSGDIMVLGVGGKMGPTLAMLAKRAAPAKRVIGVARFSDSSVRTRLAAAGVECISCDLLDQHAIEALPNQADGVENIVFMAGHKFGASDNAAFTWTMNVAVPYMVSQIFRDCRIITFSTACVYPFVPVDSAGADEDVPMTPPPGDYAASCVGRERMFEQGSQQHDTPGRLLRLSYAIDMRYGVLHDVARNVLLEQPVDVSMGHADVIWQGDANEQALQLLAQCTTPTSAINITGPDHISIRWLAHEFGRCFSKTPAFNGEESSSSWLLDTSLAQSLFGRPRVSIEQMIEWTADWVLRDMPNLGKPTHFSARDGKY